MKRITFLIVVITLVLAGCNQLNIKELFNEHIFAGDNTQIDHTTISNENKNVGTPSDVEDEWVLEEQYFNDVSNMDGILVILNPENVLSLVNKQHTLPDYYTPEDLVAPNVAFSFGNVDVPKRYMRKEAAVALEKLFEAAKNDEMHLFAVSGYRSYSAQLAVFNSQVNKWGKDKANETVAIPGQSEHQTGLAMDISSQSNNLHLTESFGETPEGNWVRENAHKYGFIIRYPKGKEEITGYQYEPWHLRYVGVKIATQIYENQLTLEEYFDKVEKM